MTDNTLTFTVTPLQAALIADALDRDEATRVYWREQLFLTSLTDGDDDAADKLSDKLDRDIQAIYSQLQEFSSDVRQAIGN